MPSIFDIIPGSNRIEAAYSRGTDSKVSLLSESYSSGFIGAFLVRRVNIEAKMLAEGWSRRVGEWLRDEWFAEKEGPKILHDLSLPGADIGGCYMNHQPAIDAWVKANKIGVMPFSCSQDYGSCVAASGAEILTALLGLRLAAGKREVWKTSCSWYEYALRGYCSDGWNAWGYASAFSKLGAAFRQPYDIGGNRLDLTGDDQDERTWARQYCRNGPPQWMKEHTNEHHKPNMAAVVEFSGAIPSLVDAFAAKGVLHFSGTRISGGSKPFTPGSVGPHQMLAYGCDGSEEGRRWFKDKCGYALAADDVAVHCGNTWGEKTGQWGGECADQYWPPHWGVKTPGSWICSAKWFMRNLSQDMVYFPDAFPGFPGEPGPTPIDQPKLSGPIYAEVNSGGGISVRGFPNLELDGRTYEYVVVPDGAGRYTFQPKLIV